MATWVTADLLSGVLDRHAAALELYAAQWSDSPEDCVQEALIELVRQPAPPNNVAAWLFHAVRLRAISSQRSGTRRRSHEAMAARLTRGEFAATHEPAFSGTELAAGLGHLDDELREIVVARIWGGLGFAEIGDMLGLTTSTAFRRFQAGLTALRRILEEPCTLTNPANCPPKTDPRIGMK